MKKKPHGIKLANKHSIWFFISVVEKQKTINSDLKTKKETSYLKTKAKKEEHNGNDGY